MCKNRAVTLVEIMIVVAVLAIILLPITGLLKNVTDIFLRSKQTLDIQAELRAAHNFFENDFRGASFVSLGNYIYNGGCEYGSQGSIPDGWAVNFTSKTQGAEYKIITSSGYNGMNALILTGNPGVYASTGTDTIITITTPAIRTPVFTLTPGQYRFLFWYGFYDMDKIGYAEAQSPPIGFPPAIVLFAGLYDITGIPVLSSYVFIGAGTNFLGSNGAFYIQPFTVLNENRYYAVFRLCTGNSPDPSTISYGGTTYDVGFSTSDGIILDAVGVVRSRVDFMAVPEGTATSTTTQPAFWFMTSGAGSDVDDPYDMKYVRYRIAPSPAGFELRRELVSPDYSNPFVPLYTLKDTGYNFVAENISSFTITRIDVDRYFWEAPVEVYMVFERRLANQPQPTSITLKTIYPARIK